ncbi:MAG: CusA/CzcA family heavy metal efflux RND transporter [Verrucomicrobiota bacterium]|jgi:cobalt-zinc-cadmium resistance protein CzcA
MTLKSVIAACLSRRAIVVFALISFVGAGLYAFHKINIESYPNPTPVILEITAEGPGLSAEEIERYYTIPMEIALYSTPGVEVIRSTSFYGLAFVRVVFKWGVDYDFAYAQATLALQQNCTLPGGQIPSVNQNSGSGEIYRYTVQGSKRYSLTDLRTIQDWIVLRRLSTINGIININSWGGTTKEFEMQVDPAKLEAYGLTIPQILAAVGNANINVGGREIVLGQQSINIRGVGLIDDGGNDDLTQGNKVDDIENIVLGQSSSVPVLIKDVAKVVVGYVPRLGIFGLGTNDDVVGSIVVMTRTKQTSEMLPKVKDMVAKINIDGSLPPGVKVVPFYDRGYLIDLTTHTVVHNLVMGIILVFLIQWIFLGDLRSAVIVGINIPFALFFALILLWVRGEGANLLSIGAVDFGIIVDSAVILVENIFRNFQKAPSERHALFRNLADGFWGPNPTQILHTTPGQSWSDRLRLILISALQVDKAIFFAALITVAGFVPLFTMQGVEGQIFGPMARTYGFALAGALIATFTITPVIASFLLPTRLKEAETIVVRLLHKVYNPTLRFALNHRFLIVGITIVFLAVTALVSQRLGSEFLPALEENNYWIRASMPTTLSLQDGEAATHKMRMILLRHPEFIANSVTSQHGRPDNGTDASPFSNVEIFAPLKPLDQWEKGMTKDKLTAELQVEFTRELPGVIFNFSQYIQDNIEEAISGVKSANSVKILGPNLETLTKLAADIQDQLSHVTGITDLGIFPVFGQPNLNIKIDRTKTARYGLNSGDVNTVIQAALGGTTATQVLEGDREWNLVVRYAPQYRDSIEKIRNLKVGYTTASGANAYIPLKELADVRMSTGGSWIYHETMTRFIPVKFSVRGRDLAGAVSDAQERIKRNIKLPSGYRLIWSGEFEDLQLARERLEFIVPLSFLLILLLLYFLFNVYSEVLLALLGIPFAISGGVLALYLTGQPFSISAAIGFVSLFGVSVMNGILLITYYNQSKLGGQKPLDAMFNAASTRMRPLLMTSLSACIGLLPAAMSHGIGSQVQRPLATVIVGGMLLGPVMLLIVVPALTMVFLGRGADTLGPDATAVAPNEPPSSGH